jgi:small ligand-binding sensory domain FIST
MPFAAGLSEHPVTALAVGEVVGHVLDALGPGARPPDLAVLFVTSSHAGALEDAAGAVRTVLGPGALVGCAAETVVGGDREVEEQPAVSLWAGHTGPVVPFHLRLETTPDGDTLVGWPDPVPGAPSALLLLADPFSFPADAFLSRVGDDFPHLPVVGGMASAARGPGGNRLVLDDRVVDHGAVGAFFGPDVGVATVVSQGCRPVGDPYAVTKAERNIVYELAGRPALERLQDVARRASDDDRRLLGQGVHLGRVIDEQQATYDRGDFLIRNLIGADPDNGAIAVGDLVEVGQTAQFQVRDAASADEDLRELMNGRMAEAALLFTCNGRGSRLFGVPDHDAEVVADTLGHRTVAGMSCAGELGPVGGRNFLHGFTASVVLLRPRAA